MRDLPAGGFRIDLELEVRNDLEEEEPIALEWCKLPTDEGEPARWWSKDPALHINYEVVELTVGE